MAGGQALGEPVIALDAEQTLDDALGLLVAPLAEVTVADDPLPVDEVQRRPVVVVERIPDRVVVVERDWVVDLSLAGRLSHAIDLVLEGELRRVCAKDDQPVVSIRLRPGAHVGLRTQPVDAGVRPEIDDDHLSSEALPA